MNLRAIQYYQDNFCYLFKAIGSQYYTVVDPGHSSAILKLIAANKWVVDRVFLTHKHWDHIGDFAQFHKDLTSFYQDEMQLSNHKVEVYAGSKE